ncbi:transposon-encoded TnpW family protein [[Clostridium] leptum]|uniref:Uncharacterized protein n=1 Tax=Solibaculum mannosilyticum TaxID=2780922 RepID=A0A7I8D1H5_9FIRM|nr:transposon-encoded TnpW family protein [Solibaculum mannosilyticum]MCO7137919.1 transposon-encoded TnpW family protein [[Clostridium] leptum]BCI60596.1 hypothetical protein C12CBH8_12350 [Solibaculum mannosilyticum]
MTDKKEHIRQSMRSTAPADCVTEIRIGNSVLVVSGFFKKDGKENAADKMAKVLEAEAATQKPSYILGVKKRVAASKQPP